MAGILIRILFFLLPFSAAGQMFGSLSNDDPDAFTLINTATITETSHRDGLDIITKDLKAYGLWTSFYAIYPYAGSTNAQHKYNLKDIRDLDAAYRLTFTNSPTSSTNGLDFNGTNQDADTKFSTFPSLDSRHISAYLRESTQIAGSDMGNTGISADNGIGLYARWLAANDTYWNTDNAVFQDYPSTTNSQGFWVVTRTASNARALYQNGASLQTSTTTSSASPTTNIKIGHDASVANFSDRQTAFNSIGVGLTSGQITLLNTIVERYEDKLGRGVQ